MAVGTCGRAKDVRDRRRVARVGFNIEGYELGLDPDESISKAGRCGSVAYWRVADIEDAVGHFVASGAVVLAPARDVGDGIKVATVADPFGNQIGLLENPHFALPDRPQA